MSTRREFLKAMALAWVGGLAPQLGQRFYDGGFVPFAGPICLPFHCSRLRPDQLNMDGFYAAIERLNTGPQSLVIEHIAMVERITADGQMVWRRLDTGKVVG